MPRSSSRLAAGCSGTTTSTPQPTDLIGPEGGIVQVREGPLAGASISVPPGALDHQVRLTIASAGDLSEEGFHPWGPALVLGPAGQTFLKPVTVTLPVPPTIEAPTAYQVTHTKWSPAPVTSKGTAPRRRPPRDG